MHGRSSQSPGNPRISELQQCKEVIYDSRPSLCLYGSWSATLTPFTSGKSYHLPSPLSSPGRCDPSRASGRVRVGTAAGSRGAWEATRYWAGQGSDLYLRRGAPRPNYPSPTCLAPRQGYIGALEDRLRERGLDLETEKKMALVCFWLSMGDVTPSHGLASTSSHASRFASHFPRTPSRLSQLQDSVNTRLRVLEQDARASQQESEASHLGTRAISAFSDDLRRIRQVRAMIVCCKGNRIYRCAPTPSILHFPLALPQSFHAELDQLQADMAVLRTAQTRAAADQSRLQGDVQAAFRRGTELQDQVRHQFEMPLPPKHTPRLLCR